MLRMITALAMAAGLLALDMTAGATTELAPGVTLVAGAVPEDRGPDGNSVIFSAPEGLVVVDTGRHPEHSDAILAFAARERRPIAAILNTHWHLDHSSGNRRLKAVFPEAKLYATNALDRALTSFIARNLARAQERLAAGGMPAGEEVETRLFVETMEARESLRPDVVIGRSERMRIAGRRFDVRVTDHAVTDADLWLYDRRTHVAVLGDLVTLPAPFFETACTERWREALDEVWATPFRIAVPGHGAPMTRDQFAVYRAAYGAFIDCVHGESEARVCAAAWSDAVAALMPEAQRGDALAYADYYVGFLREHDGESAECQKA
jgi:glyoxylase-like metal-dependent hydrolase (beta-lactamase superfamily II)